MTTAILILTGLAVSFAAGFLIADSRAVHRCNGVLDGHLQHLLRAMLEDDRPVPVDVEDEPERPTVH
jgi:hypothetical protein